MHLLIAEDDPVIADGLVTSLRGQGFAVDHVTDGASADAALAVQTFDLLILDLGLPRLSGLEVLKRLRSRKSTMPVLILTAHGSVDDRVQGLDHGADDYLTKPFNLRELFARVRALTRRGQVSQGTLIEYGPLTYDQMGRVARINGALCDLSARELGVLEILLTRLGRLVSKEQMASLLCEWGEEVSENAIEVYVHRLRKKLEDSNIKITTLRGLGYCLERWPEQRDEATA
jgi:two-component system, OmpR family, response regulator